MRRVALVAAAALALAYVARLPAAWESGNALNHVSGVWLTLADDLARGTLYRPLHARRRRYGGTRYFPLAFALEAGLVRDGRPAPRRGVRGSRSRRGSSSSLGVAALLRALGAARGDAAASAAARASPGSPGSTPSPRRAATSSRSALSALALARRARARAGRRPRRRRARSCLAFAAKPTALTAAAAAAVLSSPSAGERAPRAPSPPSSPAARLAVVAATDALSSGRFLALARPRPRRRARASTPSCPRRSASPSELALGDPAGLVLAGAAAAVARRARSAALARAVRDGDADPRLLPALWVVASWAGALVVLRDAGHRREPPRRARGRLGRAPRRRRPPRRADGASPRAVAPAAAAAGRRRSRSRSGAPTVASSRLAELRAVVRALPPGGPVLSEDPLVPLLAGESPVLLDPFAMRLAAGARPRARARPSRRRFGAARSRRWCSSRTSTRRPPRLVRRGNLGLPLAPRSAAATGARRRSDATTCTCLASAAPRAWSGATRPG